MQYFHYFHCLACNPVDGPTLRDAAATAATEGRPIVLLACCEQHDKFFGYAGPDRGQQTYLEDGGLITLEEDQARWEAAQMRSPGLCPACLRAGGVLSGHGRCHVLDFGINY